jgi:hypothetical protein
MCFEIQSEIADIETFAAGTGIREIGRLRKIYGLGRWRKRKGIAPSAVHGWHNPSG